MLPGSKRTSGERKPDLTLLRDDAYPVTLKATAGLLAATRGIDPGERTLPVKDNLRAGRQVLDEELPPVWGKVTQTSMSRQIRFTTDLRDSLSKTRVSADAPDFFKIPDVQQAVSQEKEPWEYITRAPKQSGPIEQAYGAASPSSPTWMHGTGRQKPAVRIPYKKEQFQNTTIIREFDDHPGQRKTWSQSPVNPKRPPTAGSFSRYLRPEFAEFAKTRAEPFMDPTNTVATNPFLSLGGLETSRSSTVLSTARPSTSASHRSSASGRHTANRAIARAASSEVGRYRGYGDGGHGDGRGDGHSTARSTARSRLSGRGDGASVKSTARSSVRSGLGSSRSSSHLVDRPRTGLSVHTSRSSASTSRSNLMPSPLRSSGGRLALGGDGPARVTTPASRTHLYGPLSVRGPP